MNAVERANSLLQSAYALAQRKGSIDQQAFYRLANEKANEIRDFLQEPGVEQELDKAGDGDRGPVALLGRVYDDLVLGVIDTSRYLSPAPFFVGLKSFAEDVVVPGAVVKNAAEFYGSAAADAIKEATKPAAEAFRKVRPWLIAAGALGAAFAAAYVWRSFK